MTTKDVPLIWVSCSTTRLFRRSAFFLIASLFVLSGCATQVTTNTEDQIHPAISGDYIVWADRRDDGTYWNIYLYEISSGSETPITTAGSVTQPHPAISGDYVVWEDDRHGNLDLYLYEISSGTETRVTDETASQRLPDISGDYIVWNDNRHGNDDVYLYEISSGTEAQITTGSAVQSHPDISGNYVVWQDDRSGNWDIYMLEFSAGFFAGGWIDSPSDAYADDPSLTGKASFNFASKYEKGEKLHSPRSDRAPRMVEFRRDN